MDLLQLLSLISLRALGSSCSLRCVQGLSKWQPGHQWQLPNRRSLYVRCTRLHGYGSSNAHATRIFHQELELGLDFDVDLFSRKHFG